jgi:hypothetical protein
MADLHFLLNPEDSFLEADCQIEPQVITLPRSTTPGPRRAGGSSTKATEKRLKEIGKATHITHIGHSGSPAQTGLAELVVPGPGLGVAQNLIGAANLLEFVFGTGILVDVRVKLPGKTPVGALQGVGVNISTDTQHIVKVGHGSGLS